MSGRNAFSGKCLSKTGFEPLQIEVYPALDVGGGSLLRRALTLEVSRDGEALWLEDPDVYSLNTDIAVLRLPDAVAHRAVRCINKEEEQLVAVAGADCFVLGYSTRYYGDPYAPIWRKASFAYEPSLPVNGKPVFLLDVFSTPGMSGSPIVQRWFGPAPRRVGDAIEVNLHCVVSSRLVGVYGGRIDDTAVGPIGYGWYANRIDNIILQERDMAVSHFSFPDATSRAGVLVDLAGAFDGAGSNYPFAAPTLSPSGSG